MVLSQRATSRVVFVRIAKIGMRIVNTGVYHRNQNAFSGQTIAAVFLNGTQTGSLPGRNNLKEKLSWTFDIYYLWKGGK